MASKTINIDADLYEKIKIIKGNMSFTEFFSDLLKRTANPPIEVFGALSEMDLDYQEVKRSRRDRDVDF